MKDGDRLTDNKGNLNRRSMVKNGATLLGAGFLGSFVNSSVVTANLNANNIYNVKDFGATGKRADKATIEVRTAVDACAAAGGGTVYIPPGEYTVGTIQLKDNVNLNIEGGATLYLSQDPGDFIQGAYSMIFAENANNIAVTGRGTLNGLAKFEFVEMRGIDPEIEVEIEIARKAGVDMRRYYHSSMESYMLVLNNCTNIQVRDISLIDSPLWNIRLNECDRVFIRGINIITDLEKAVLADGIDICSTRNVTISDCVIVTGDDSITLKTPLRKGQDTAKPVENIVVTNCILSSSSSAIKIGTETFADIRYAIFSNCTIRNSNKGFGIDVRDGATVSNIIFRNLTIETNRRHWNWWGSAEMCKFLVKKRRESSRVGEIKNIVIDTVIAYTRGTSLIKGYHDQPLENIRLNNIQIFMNPEDAIDKRTSDALVIENVNALKLQDVSINWNDNKVEKNWQSALVLKKVSDFEVRSFSGRQGLKDSNNPSILLDNISEGLITESHAEVGCAAFIQIRKEESGNLVLRNNNIAKAIREINYVD
jgi:hypothetical protein